MSKLATMRQKILVYGVNYRAHLLQPPLSQPSQEVHVAQAPPEQPPHFGVVTQLVRLKEATAINVRRIFIVFN